MVFGEARSSSFWVSEVSPEKWLVGEGATTRVVLLEVCVGGGDPGDVQDTRG